MSFCPSRDVHSVYLDNEMPLKYIAEYEAHVKDCPKCRHELELLKGVHNLLKSDFENSSSEKLFESENFLNDSYKRLMIKMAYNKNTKFNKQRFVEGIRYSIPTAVAAAILAVVLPIRTYNANSKLDSVVVQEPVAYVESVSNIPAAKSVSFDKNRGVIISGNIHDSVLPIGPVEKVFSSKQKNNKSGSKTTTLINDYEVFRPAFSDDKTISIRITVPGMDTTPVTTEINLPYDVFTGYFE